MFPKFNRMKIAITILLCISFTLISFMTCSKKNDKNDKPEIVDCNSVKYKGYTYTNLGCAPGIASFNVTTTQGGHTASFYITCSGGCISSVEVISSSLDKSIMGPE